MEKNILLDQVTLAIRGPNLPQKTVNRLHKLLKDELKDFPQVDVVDENGGG